MPRKHRGRSALSPTLAAAAVLTLACWQAVSEGPAALLTAARAYAAGPRLPALAVQTTGAPPAVSVGDVSGAEGDFETTPFQFPVTLSKPSAQTVTVDFNTADGTAVGGGNDFFAVFPNSVTFQPGETTKNVAVQVIGDTSVEPDETFKLNLLSATNATLADAEGQGTILNDDGAPAVSLSINDVSVVEGNDGLTDAVFTVRLSSATAKTVKVDYFASEGAGSEYQVTGSSLTFEPGQTTKTFTLRIIGDRVFEPDETFTVRLANAVNATLADAEGLLTIVNDDAGPSVSIGDATVTEGDSGTREAVFTVRLSSESSRHVLFRAETFAGSATQDEDYFWTSGGMLIAPGVTATTITVHVNGDTIDEADEQFFVRLSQVEGAAVADAEGAGTILDDESASGPQTVQFTTRWRFASEGDAIDITVTRSGDASAAASVDYATSVENNFRAASERGDYQIALGTLRFAPGETSKSFRLFVTDDSFEEGQEFITVGLSNPSPGLALGNPSRGSVEIEDDDASTGKNPVDAAAFFVRQHYRDFFNREPDAAGLAFWTGQITSCGEDAACVENRRQHVSGSFFLSVEFQETGYLVYLAYQSAFGDLEGAPVPVRLREFLADTQEIGRGVIVDEGDWEQRLEQNKRAYFEAFTRRARFTQLYPDSMPAAQFVDALNQNTGGSLSQAERDSLVNALASGALTRAQALRAVAENAEFARREKNRAFVLMQYFGYLRRNPNEAPEETLDFRGYNFWLKKLEDHGGDFVAAQMVKSFLDSGEYRGRFGP